MNSVKPHQCSALDPPWFSIRVLSVEVGGNPTRGRETFDGEDWSYLDGGGGGPGMEKSGTPWRHRFLSYSPVELSGLFLIFFFFFSLYHLV